jgi:menaquinone-9 beta-reductase
VAHVQGVLGLTDRAEMHVGRRCYVGLNPIGADLANVALVVPHAETAAASGDVTDYFFRILDGFPGVRGRVPRAGLARRVRVTGPFAATSRRVITDGALLVGDAAEFFDPFTGEGICTALRGASFAVESIAGALERPGIVRRRDLTGYVRARRAAFAGKWAVERLIGWGLQAPALFDRALERLERRGLGHTFIGVTGDFVPAREILNPRVLAGMLW